MTDAIAHTEQDVEVNGITLHCTTWGERTAGRTVLLVHGLTGNGRAWAALAPQLAARGWFVVAQDLRGRGRSSKPPHGYGIPYHADGLLALCDALGSRKANWQKSLEERGREQLAAIATQFAAHPQ